MAYGKPIEKIETKVVSVEQVVEKPAKKAAAKPAKKAAEKKVVTSESV